MIHENIEECNEHASIPVSILILMEIRYDVPISTESLVANVWLCCRLLVTLILDQLYIKFNNIIFNIYC